MTTYATDLVAGDTATQVSQLRVGDRVRMYSGLADTVTITRVVDRGLSQGIRRHLDLHYSDGTVSTYVRSDDVRHLATGPARQPEGEEAGPQGTPAVETYYSDPYADGARDAARVQRYDASGRAYSPSVVEAAASEALGRNAVALQRIDAWVYCRAAVEA
jgi:hypothetical protein